MRCFILLVTSFLFITSQVAAQKIRFEKDSLRQVFAKARQQNKPVFVLFAPPPPPADLPPELRAARTQSGLSAPAVVARLNRNFLSKELVFGTAESAALGRKYNVSSYPTYLYFAADATLLHRNSGNAATEARYLQDLAAVQLAQADPQNLGYFQRGFEQGNQSADFLRQYLLKQRQLDLVTEPVLLQAYVRELPVKAFEQGAEVLFVLESGPVLNSKAYQLTHLGNKLTDSLYRVLPLPQRMAINNRIIRHTMAEAARTKNRTLAMEGANFARSSWTKDYVRGARAYELNMLDFFRSTRDTAAYLRQAVGFYDRQNAAVSADSARKIVGALRAFRQQQQQARQQAAAAYRQTAGQPAAASTTSSTRLVGISSGPPDSFVQELNNAAWAIYQTGTRSPEYLLRATVWSKRTVSLDPAAYNYDTLAHLLYRLQFYQEAEATQRQAIKYAREAKVEVTMYEKELRRMKSRVL